MPEVSELGLVVVASGSRSVVAALDLGAAVSAWAAAVLEWREVVWASRAAVSV